jgi:hypothetical protein
MKFGESTELHRKSGFWGTPSSCRENLVKRFSWERGVKASSCAVAQGYLCLMDASGITDSCSCEVSRLRRQAW